nr:hypothetical protein [Tanacetum cinerariifolium]
MGKTCGTILVGNNLHWQRELILPVGTFSWQWECLVHFIPNSLVAHASFDECVKWRSDHLGKFDGKADEGYLIGYSASNKAYRVYNVLTKRVDETMNLYFLENKPNVQGLGLEWYFDLDYLTDSFGYKHASANQSACTQGNTTTSAGTQDADSDSNCDEQVIIIPSYPSHNIQGTHSIDTAGTTITTDAEELRTPTSVEDVLSSCIPIFTGLVPVPTGLVPVPTGSIPVTTGSIPVPAGGTTVPTDEVPVHTGNTTDSMFDKPTTRFPYPSNLENHNPLPSIFFSSSYDDEFDTALNNVDSSVQVSPVPTKRIHTIHPQSLIIGDPTSVEEMKQFKFQNVWVLVKLPLEKYATQTKWILKNKQDARGIVVCNKAGLVAQGHLQEEGIDYDEVFAPVTRIEAIRLFLAFASYMGFLVYQMDVKSAFLYGRIKEEVYVTQPKGFWILNIPQRSTRLSKLCMVYVDDIVIESTKKEWCDEFEALMKGEFQMSAMGKLTFFIGNVRTATTPYEAPKPKSKSKFDSPINVHLYRSMIGSLMYLTALRTDIMFVVNACSRHQITPNTSNLEAVKKIFKYLKGQPKLGLWYPKESPLVLEAYSDSDYAGANSDRKSITGGCQFLGRRLISWQCKKQTIVATSSTEAEYVAIANCCGQFWSMATLRAPELGPPAIMATIDNTPYTITEELVRSLLQLADDEGVTNLPILEIYFGMDALGYVTEGSWDQFGSPIAIALICLSDGRRFNWSNYIFRGMVNNVGNAKEFLIPHSLDLVAPVLEHDHSSAQPETTTGFFPSMKDAHIGADYYTSPVRSSHTPPVDHPSGAELHDYKKLFKNVVGKLVKKVKSLEVKLKTKKRKMVVSDSDEEDDTTPNVNLEALRALANAVVADDSDAATDVPVATSTTPAGASSVAPGASTVALGASIVAPGASTIAPGASGVVHVLLLLLLPTVPPGASNKGKSLMIEEDIPVLARKLRQMKEDRLARMAALIKKKRQALAKQLFKERKNRPLTPAQQKAYMRRTFKRPGSVLEEPPTKRPKSPEAPTPSMPEIPIPPAVSSPPSFHTQRKSIVRKHEHKPKPKIPTLDLDAPAQAFLKVIIDEDLDDVDSVNEAWSTVVGWEILSTPLGGKGSSVWKNQHLWEIRSWRLYTLLNLHILETMFGEVLLMFTYVTYPLSVELMKKMLIQKLELDLNFVGNDLTTAEQLIQFIKNQIVAIQASSMVTTCNNSNDNVPNFEAMINVVVANALPNLTAALRTQITNDIRNGAGPSGGGGGDAIPYEIHVWSKRFTKLKSLAFRSAATPAEAED